MIKIKEAKRMVRPLNNYVLIRPLKPTNKYYTVPDSQEHTVQTAEVVEISHEAEKYPDRFPPMVVKVGDTVIFRKRAGVEIDGGMRLVNATSDIIAKIETSEINNIDESKE